MRDFLKKVSDSLICSFLVSNLSDLLTSLRRNEQFFWVFFIENFKKTVKTYKKHDFSYFFERITHF